MHSLNYLLYTCSPRWKTSVLVRGQDPSFCKRDAHELPPPLKKKRDARDLSAETWCLPGLGSIAQVVVKTAALRRAGAHRGDKFTCGHAEPQQQDEQHFGPLLRICCLTTCAQVYAHKSLRDLRFLPNLYQFYPHGFLSPPLRCPIVIRLQ